MSAPNRPLPPLTGLPLFITWFDDGLIEFDTTVFGGGAGTAAKDTTQSELGSGSAKFTTAAVNLATVSMTKNINGQYMHTVSLEAGFRPQTDVTTAYLMLQVTNGGIADTAQIVAAWTGTSTTLSYQNNASGYTVLATIPYNLFQGSAAASVWHTFKVVADFTVPGAANYEALFFDGARYDMTGIPTPTGSATGGIYRIGCNITAQANAAAAKIVNFGHVFLLDFETQS